MCEAKENGCSSNDQVLLLPFMARGHLIPFAALARLLELRTPYAITIINTPLNIQWLRSSLPPNTRIQLAHIPFDPTLHGLPPTSENTHSLLPPHLLLPFYQSSQYLKPALDRLVAALPRPPLCIIADEFTSWSLETARQLGVPHYIFETSGAYSTAVFTSFLTHLPHRQSDADELNLPDLPRVKLSRSELLEDVINMDRNEPWGVLFQKIISDCANCDGVLVNTVEEMESEALNYLREKVWRRAWAVGPLLLSPSSPSSPALCAEWLNLRRRESVLYISFGTQNTLNSHQMMELAKGLEASGRTFIWVIRPPAGFDADGEFQSEWLPEGFEERMAETEKGILVKKWAPQMEILSHESTGAFLSHCGWNSILESLSCGVPIIGWPMAADQPFNSKQAEEELGVGVEMARGTGAEICAENVAKLIQLVLDEESEKGKEMRRKAKEMQKVNKAAVSDGESDKGSSVRAVESFLQTMVSAAARGE